MCIYLDKKLNNLLNKENFSLHLYLDIKIRYLFYFRQKYK